MQAVLDDFARRTGEVSGYLEMLHALDRTGAAITGKRSRPVKVEDEWRRVSKAGAYLMIYNLVESSVRAAFSHVYSAMETDGCDLQSASEKLRLLWIDHHHRSIDRESSPPSRYREIAKTLVSAALANEGLRLQSSRLPISGNLDAEAIRYICHNHGVSVVVPRAAKGGEVLDAVKEQRNALAHGDKSFAECGREVTVSDLRRIFKQAVTFLRAILRNIEAFVNQRAYRCNPAAAS